MPSIICHPALARGAEVAAANLVATVWRENELGVAQKCTAKAVAPRRFVSNQTVTIFRVAATIMAW